MRKVLFGIIGNSGIGGGGVFDRNVLISKRFFSINVKSQMQQKNFTSIIGNNQTSLQTRKKLTSSSLPTFPTNQLPQTSNFQLRTLFGVNKKAMNFLEEASKYRNSKQYDLAIQSIQECLKEDLKMKEGWMMKALIEEEMGNLREAVNSYKQLIEIDSAQHNARGRLANILVLIGNPSEAIEHYKVLESSNLKGQQTLIKQAMGIAYQQMGEFDSAIECYSQVLEVDSTNRIALGNLGTIYSQHQDPENAIYFHEKAHLLQQSDPVPIANLCGSYLMNGNVEMSLEFLRKLDVSSLLNGKSEYDKLVLKPEKFLDGVLHQIEQFMKNPAAPESASPEKLKDILEELVSITAQNQPSLQNQLQSSLLLLGNLLSISEPKRAIEILSTLNQLSANDWRCAVLLANNLLRVSNSTQALEVLYPFAEQEVVEVQLNLGNCYLVLGQLQQAKTHLEKALQLNPNYQPGVLNFNLAACYMGLGNNEIAKKHMEIAKQHSSELNPQLSQLINNSTLIK